MCEPRQAHSKKNDYRQSGEQSMRSDRRLAAQTVGVACLAWLVAIASMRLAIAQPADPEATTGIEPIRLSEGVPVDTTHAAGETVTYLFEGEPGETYLIELEQHVLDLVVTIEDPSGNRNSFDSALYEDAAEFVLLENIQTGDYVITINSDTLTTTREAHTIVISTLDSGGLEALYHSAWRSMSEGAEANAAESRGQEALRHYEAAAELWEALGETKLRAQALFNAAMLCYWALYDWEGAAEQAAAAAELYNALGERSLYGQARLTQAYSLMEVAQLAGEDGEAIFADAMDAFLESRAVHEALGDDYRLAAVENYIGLAYYNRADVEKDDYGQARSHYALAEKLFSDVGMWLEALRVRHNRALIDLDEGYASKAARDLADAIAQIPEGRASRDHAHWLTNLGFAHLYAGDFDPALEAFSEALERLASEEQLEQEQGRAERGLGSAYFALGELERAEQYFRQALEKLTEDGRIRAAVLTNLGNVAYLNGDFTEAVKLHEQAVTATTSVAYQAYRESFVARDLVELGRFEEAIAVAKTVFGSPETGAVSRADLAVQLGFAHLGIGSVREATDYFDSALAFYESVGLQAEQAEALRGRALAARDVGELARAIHYGEESLKRIESLRTNVSAPELRAFYSAAQRKYYETQIDLLMSAYMEGVDSNALSAALSVSERARARMTAELLAEAASGLSRNIPPAMLEHQQGLYEELSALRYRRDRLLETASPSESALDAILRRIADVENELSLLETEIRRRNPGDAEQIMPQPLSAAGMQAMLDTRLALVQYALGKDKSYAWVVTSDSIHAVELAGRETIEAAGREAYDVLRSYPRAASDDLSGALNALSELVIAPVAPFFGSHERLIIAADGALAYLPFGALPIERDGETVRLLESFQITSAPSMSVLATRRAQARSGAPGRTLAVFADPVFTKSDLRFAEPAAAAIASEILADNTLTRSPAGSALARLPSTAAEAQAIADLVPENLRFVATGFDASRETALSADLGDYRVVHFATHGLVDSRYPGLSALALSQFDQDGSPKNGFLRLHDIYGLELNADLVVLSGCETALGRDIRGEGLVGLVQGFLYAGARNLVVSLWQIPDRATAELMMRFYHHILNEGLPPAEALRQAQLSIAAERRWRDPYFWGAFVVLEGE
jgi:CHAT domain-containing protein/Flp pilus assembly protein TadD